MEDKIIDITAYIGRDLKSRVAAREFYDKISNKQRTNIKIDFGNVSFATRSFMDEFYNIFIANADMNLELINLSAEMEAMLDAVKATQHRPKNSANWISFHHDDIRFSSISEANKYLDALPFS